jgi:S-(hydroxymethyl)glutathione dehydrogenase/alcohol dehydrogenase
VQGIAFTDEGLTITDALTVRDVRPGEVRVRIVAAGVCHSDVSVIDGTIPFPRPVVLGHEGAGVVEAVGDGVTHLAEGDHVVLTTLGSCGHCASCETGRPTMCKATAGKLSRPFTLGGEKAFAFANLGVFSEAVVVQANQAVPINRDVPFEVASLIGCGVLTGIGAVLNRARVRPGESALVVGAGGIGLNVLQGLALANASPVVVVDTNPSKEVLARRMGATHFVVAGEGVDTTEAVRAVCPDGVDWAFECVGHPALIRQAVDLLGWGGSVVLLGVPKLGSEAAFVVNSLYHDKSILGCRYGSSRPAHDIPLYIRLWQEGRLHLDELVTRTYPLGDVQQLLDDLHHGELARGVLQVAEA